MEATIKRGKPSLLVAIGALVALMAGMFAWALPAQAANTWFTASVNQGSCEVRVPKVTVTSTKDANGFGYRVDGTNFWTVSGQAPDWVLPAGTYSFSLPEVEEGKSVTFQVIAQEAYQDVPPDYSGQTFTFSVPDCTPPDPGPQPEAKVETRTVDVANSLNCEAGTVDTANQERTAEYALVDNKWVLGDWSEWVTVSTDTRPATAEECPVTPDPGPQPEAKVETRTIDVADSLDCEAGTVDTANQERTREYVLVDGEWVLGEWSDWETVSTSTRPATAEECPVTPDPGPQPGLDASDFIGVRVTVSCENVITVTGTNSGPDAVVAVFHDDDSGWMPVLGAQDVASGDNFTVVVSELTDGDLFIVGAYIQEDGAQPVWLSDMLVVGKLKPTSCDAEQPITPPANDGGTKPGAKPGDSTTKPPVKDKDKAKSPAQGDKVKSKDKTVQGDKSKVTGPKVQTDGPSSGSGVGLAGLVLVALATAGFAAFRPRRQH